MQYKNKTQTLHSEGLYSIGRREKTKSKEYLSLSRFAISVSDAKRKKEANKNHLMPLYFYNDETREREID